MKVRRQAIRSFRDLETWMKGIELVKSIHRTPSAFPKEETFGLTGQLRRAAVSVPSTIAEGHIRNHQEEFKQCLYLSLSSLAELETQVIISKELGYVNQIKYDTVISDSDILGKQTRPLITRLNPSNESQATT